MLWIIKTFRLDLQVLMIATEVDALTGEGYGYACVCVSYIDEVFMVTEVEVVHYDLCVELSESR